MICRRLILIVSLILAADAQAAIKTYIGGAGTGNWSAGSNWSSFGQPLDGDNVVATPADSLNRTILFDGVSSLAFSYGTVTLGSAGAGTTSLLNVGSVFEANALVLGIGSAYSMSGSADTFVTSTFVNGGTLAQLQGVYHAATITQTAGTTSFGSYAVSNRFTMQGGTLIGTVTNNGTFDFIGGTGNPNATIINNGTLSYNNAATSLGSIIENHGTMIFSTVATLGSLQNYVSTTFSGSQTLTMGALTQHTGTFMQTGNIAVNAGLTVEAATYDMRAGRLLVGGIAVGANHNGPLNGTLLVSGGFITGGGLSLGASSATGTLTQSGGSILLNGNLFIGQDFNSRGYCSISAGSLLANNFVLGGRNAISGTLVQTGGLVGVGSFIANEDSASSSSILISGGSFVANTSTNNGVFTQTGGGSSFAQLYGAGSISVTGTGTLSALAIRQTSLQIGGSAAVKTSLNGATTSRVSAFSMEEVGNNVLGRWDLLTGALVVDYPGASPVAAIRRYLKSGHASGNWNGAGLDSSVAAAANPHNTALGYSEASNIFGASGGAFDGIAVDGTAVLVKYTYNGDTDLNGIVDFDDYSHTDNGFNNAGTDWFHGDFDYNGHVDFDDYSLIDLAFNTQSGTLRRAVTYLEGYDRTDGGMNTPALRLVQRHFQQFDNAYAISFLNAVPEPAVIGSIGIGAMLLRRSRGGRSR